MNEKNSSHKQRLAILLAVMFYSAAIIGFSLYLDRQISKLLSAHTVWVATIGILAVIIGAGLFGWFSLQKWALQQGRDAFSNHAVKADKLQLFGITLLIWGIAFCAGNTLIGWLLSMTCCVLLIIQQWNRLKQISKFGESNWYILGYNTVHLIMLVIIGVYIALAHNTACITFALLMLHRRLAEASNINRLNAILKKYRRNNMTKAANTNAL